MPAQIPPTLIVQHMPKEFTRRFAESLSKFCAFEVKEAEDNDRVIPGKALLAPGDLHMELLRLESNYFVRLKSDPPVHSVRPAADPLFISIAKYAGKNSIGVILTGMGQDGAKGLLEMKKAGSFNIAQDENTSVVFGMPKVAITIGAVDAVLPLERIADRIMKECEKREGLN